MAGARRLAAKMARCLALTPDARPLTLNVVNDKPAPTQRVSAMPFPERYDLPARPEGASPAVQDAFRQTSFLLGKDLRLFAEGMNLQLRIVADASPSAFRKHPYAALMGLWSRSHLALSDCCLLATRGSYPTIPPIARLACELIAAQQQLQVAEMDLFAEWLAAHFRPNEEHKAFEFGLGRYFAGETLAADDRLRAVYRPASELGRPSFGPTVLHTGPESNNLRLALTFADPSFHFGWAQIVLGWLLSLCERQLAVAVHAKGIFPIQDDVHSAYLTYRGAVDEALSRSDRCFIEEIEEGQYRRYLVHNFHRAPSGAPKKYLL